MNQWVFFHSVVHGWGWEKLDADSNVVAESRSEFETQQEAEHDATAHGYVPGASVIVADAVA